MLTGKRKEYFLLLIKAPPNKAMAPIGVKFHILYSGAGMSLHRAARKIMTRITMFLVVNILSVFIVSF